MMPKELINSKPQFLNHLEYFLRALSYSWGGTLLLDGCICYAIPWASYQIRKIAGCACAGNAGNVFPRRRFQRKLLVSDPGMHHGTCVTHVPWCMSGSLTCGDGENVPGIPSACAPAILRIWQEAHNGIFVRHWALPPYYFHVHLNMVVIIYRMLLTYWPISYGLDYILKWILSQEKYVLWVNFKTTSVKLWLRFDYLQVIL